MHMLKAGMKQRASCGHVLRWTTDREDQFQTSCSCVLMHASLKAMYVCSCAMQQDAYPCEGPVPGHVQRLHVQPRLSLASGLLARRPAAVPYPAPHTCAYWQHLQHHTTAADPETQLMMTFAPAQHHIAAGYSLVNEELQYGSSEMAGRRTGSSMSVSVAAFGPFRTRWVLLRASWRETRLLFSACSWCCCCCRALHSWAMLCHLASALASCTPTHSLSITSCVSQQVELAISCQLCTAPGGRAVVHRRSAHSSSQVHRAACSAGAEPTLSIDRWNAQVCGCCARTDSLRRATSPSS